MPSNQKQIKNKWFKWDYSFSWNNFLFLPFLVLSALFWLSTELSNDLQYKKDVYIDFVVASDRVVREKLPEKLAVKLAGKGWDLIFLEDFNAQNPFQYHLAADKAYLNKSEILSQMNILLANKSIQVLDVNFVSQPIQQEYKLSKKLPVRFKGSLNFESFYKLKNAISFSPDSILLTGPRSAIDTMTLYYTEYQDLNSINKDLEKDVKLDPIPAHYFEVEPELVSMKIQTEQITEKILSIPVRIANETAPNYTIVPDEIEIRFLIGLSEFTHITADDFIAQIVLPAEILPNQQFAVSIVKKPSSAEIRGMKPAYVDVFFDY
jgi:hypothetical protein